MAPRKRAATKVEKPAPVEAVEAVEEPKYPSAAQRKGKRAHDEQGNVRPADGRWDLHDPADESKHVRTPKPQ